MVRNPTLVSFSLYLNDKEHLLTIALVRANQKDVYYQSILQEQMTRVAQQFLGARRQHVWQKEINTISDICYYGLTTLLGTQTLGEEYCDIVQINQYNQTYPGLVVSSWYYGTVNSVYSRSMHSAVSCSFSLKLYCLTSIPEEQLN